MCVYVYKYVYITYINNIFINIYDTFIYIYIYIYIYGNNNDSNNIIIMGIYMVVVPVRNNFCRELSLVCHLKVTEIN